MQPGTAARSIPCTSPAGPIAPAFTLANLEGEQVSLTMLLASDKPLLLVFTDPRCNPCLELLPDIGGWQRVYGDRLSFVLISTGDVTLNRLMTDGYGMDHVLLQRERETIDAYGVTQAPAAVLVFPDRQFGSAPTYGVAAIRRLVADTLGLVVPAPPGSAIQSAGRGQAAPPLRRLGLDENLVDLAAYRGTPMVVLFWSPACTHCQDLLPGIRAMERISKRPGLIVISRGAPDLNRSVGLLSPVILDDSHEIADSFGIEGTPAAVVIDSKGIIVSEVLRGNSQVNALLDRIQVLAQRPAT